MSPSQSAAATAPASRPTSAGRTIASTPRVRSAWAHVHGTPACQHAPRLGIALGHAYVVDAMGIEHLVQGHQLEWVIFEDQDIEGAHGEL